MSEADELLDSNEAAKVLSISTKHLTKLRDRGLLPVVRISESPRGVRYSRASLNAFIAEQQSFTPVPVANK